MRYDCLINITRKNTFCSHFWHCGWKFIQLSIFQLPAVQLLEVLAHCANTGKEMLSSFIDSSIDNVLLKTNPACISHFLTSQTFLNFIWQTHCCMTVKPRNRPAVGTHRLEQMEFIDVFSFISTHTMLGLLSPASAKADFRWGEKQNTYLIASCVRNISAKYY